MSISGTAWRENLVALSLHNDTTVWTGGSVYDDRNMGLDRSYGHIPARLATLDYACAACSKKMRTYSK